MEPNDNDHEQLAVDAPLNGAKPIAENRYANLLLYAQTLYKRLEKSQLVTLRRTTIDCLFFER